jgi:hypothetical protein
MVNYIIMKQGGNVQVFKSDGQAVNGFTAVAAEACSEYAEQGPDPFAAIEKSMLEDLDQAGRYKPLACKVLQVILHGLVDNVDFRP